VISKEAIEKIESMSVPNFKENFEGDIFCDKKMYQIKPEPPPAPECGGVCFKFGPAFWLAKSPVGSTAKACLVSG